MKYEKMPIAEVREGDGPAMRLAIADLMRAGADVRRPANNAYQLKLTADTSYYPSKGTILCDGGGSILPVRGIEALLSRLRESGDLPSREADC